MPKFGDYETIDEPLRVTEAGAYSTIVWKARRNPAGEAEFYVVKQMVLGHGGGQSEEGASAQGGVGQERLRDFVAGVKQLEKASSQAGRYLARVYASGSSSNSAWYATDYYPRRSLKEFINLQGGVESQALQRVIHRVVRGCLALKQTTGLSHGNLKASNVLLAGKPQQLRKTPLHLVDPRPLRPGAATGVKQRPPEAAADSALAAQTEMADLRSIGELIVQLVEGRMIQSAYDYNYPVAASAPWDRLGKDAGLWLHRCNQLLNPQLKLNQLNLQSLEKDLRASPSVPALGPAVGILVVAVVVTTGLWYGLNHWTAQSKGRVLPMPKENDWQGWMDFVSGAETRGDWALARDTLQRQMLPKAQALKDASLEQQTRSKLDFATAMADAVDARRAGKLDLAKQGVDKALQQKPNQAAALALKAEIVAALDELAKTKELTQLMQSVQKNESQSQWSPALALLAKAVLLAAPISDPKYAQWVNGELKYAQSMEKAQNALSQGRYVEARQEAEAALAVKSKDVLAVQIQTAARTGQKYQEALKEAQDDLDKKRYAEALRQVRAALLINPAGAEAIQLSNRVQDQAFEGAQLAFNQGDYQSALDQCRVFEGTERFDNLSRQTGKEQDQLKGLEQALQQGRYESILATGWPAKPGFEKLKTTAAEENNVLEQVRRKQASGDYSYIETVEQARYGTKPPFVALVEAGRRARISTRSRPPVVPQTTQLPVESESRKFGAGRPPPVAFKPTQPTEAPIVALASNQRRLEENNKLLEYWQVLFGLKASSTDRDIKREEPAKDVEYRLEQFDRLEREFVAAGAWDAQHKQQLDTLRWLVSRGKLGEPPVTRK